MKTLWKTLLILGVGCTTATVVHGKGSCMVTCVSGSCQLSGVAQRIPSGDTALLPLCRSQNVLDGDVIASFRSQGKPARVSANAKSPHTHIKFEDLLRNYARLDCLASENASCENDRGRVVAVYPGRRFEPNDPWQPVGDPCGLGLPCGTIAVPAQTWRFRLLDSSQAGQFRVMSARGQMRDYTATIDTGKVEVPTGWVQPGQSYRYQLVDRERRVVAAGEFLTPSARAQREIEASLAEAAKQPAGLRNSALIDSLLQDGLDWDALQLTFGHKKQP